MENSKTIDTQQAEILHLKSLLTGERNYSAGLLKKFTLQKTEITRLQEDNTCLQTENTHLRKDNTHLQKEITRLQEDSTRFRTEIQELRELIKELRAQIGKNSQNSSLPPSSDGLRKKPTSMNPRKPGTRKVGGQTGHKGHTLKPKEHPDKLVAHKPKTCSKCGGRLDVDRMEKIGARQVHDLPEILPLFVTQHEIYGCQCGSCGAKNRAEFPSDIKAPVQYGSNISSLVQYYHMGQFVPINRTKQLFKETFGVKISTGTIQSMINRKAQELKPVWEEILDQALKALVKHLDETGMRVEGKLRWFHVLCTELFCHFRLGESRGDVLHGITGTIVHDCWVSYKRIESAVHALCLAHLIRELQAEFELGDEVWSQEMQEILRSAIKEIKKAKEEGTWLSDERIKEIEEFYDGLTKKAIEHYESLPSLTQKGTGRVKRRKGHNLANRMREHRAEVLLFTRDPNVPATNNLAERDIRPLKLKQKISGGFRSAQGSQDFAILRSIIETARKQKWNMLDTLKADPNELIQKLRKNGIKPEI